VPAAAREGVAVPTDPSIAADARPRAESLDQIDKQSAHY